MIDRPHFFIKIAQISLYMVFDIFQTTLKSVLGLFAFFPFLYGFKVKKRVFFQIFGQKWQKNTFLQL